MNTIPNSSDYPPVEWPVCPGRDEIIFRGHGQEAGGALITVETPEGEVLGALTHHVRHSPDGFQWGYTGSGPAETARCLLLAALDDPRCPSCAGTTKVVIVSDGHPKGSLHERPFTDQDDPASEQVLNCVDCDTGLASVPHQDFKFEIVAGWDGDWTISRSQIRAWLAAAREKTAAAEDATAETADGSAP